MVAKNKSSGCNAGAFFMLIEVFSRDLLRFRPSFKELSELLRVTLKFLRFSFGSL